MKFKLFAVMFIDYFAVVLCVCVHPYSNPTHEGAFHITAHDDALLLLIRQAGGRAFASQRVALFTRAKHHQVIWSCARREGQRNDAQTNESRVAEWKATA